MATMVDARPEYKGESKTWDSINKYLPANVIVYNNREIDGREYDFCLLCENVGILVIEVKGWLRDKISVHGIDNIEVEEYTKPQRSPKKQARAYRFGIIDKLKKKYNISPLVCDAVCYPFITQTEYYAVGLNVVSESFLTFFKEDLEDELLFTNKLHGIFDHFNNIPHSELSQKVIADIRRENEPEERCSPTKDEEEALPYSILSMHPQPMSHDEILRIVDEYFKGIKRIVFLGSKRDYEELIDTLDGAFKRHNIQANAGGLSIGYETRIKTKDNSTRLFNFEAYLIENLNDVVKEPVFIKEGLSDDVQAGALRKLASMTTFNYQQYAVEHSSDNKNILVQAGAGTGKTYSMVSRIAFLCGKLDDPVTNLVDEVAMMTFTNDAATNMKTRLKQMFVNYFILTSNSRYLLFVDEVDQANISTIHSFTIRILRKDVLYTGLGTNFRISSNEILRKGFYDQYLSQFLEEKTKENPNFPHEIPVPLYELQKSLIGLADRLLAKSVNLNEIRPEDMGVSSTKAIPYFNELIEKVVVPAERAYSYEHNSYNDLDLKEAIIRFGNVLEQHQTHIKDLKTRYLFIDEFQDTDDAQIKIFARLQQLIKPDCKFFVVGDLKQSIYRFRGATLSAFERLQELSKREWESYSLTINYRTDTRLLDQYHSIFSYMGSCGYIPYRESSDRLIGNVNSGIDDQKVFVCVEYHGKSENCLEETFIETLKEQTSQLDELMRKRAALGLKPFSKAERTIAVLVRSNWQIDRLVQSAKQKEINIETNSGGDLFRLPSTLDLYKLVSALRNSSSAVHLVNLIESNFVGLALDYRRYRNSAPVDCLKDLTRILDEFFQARMGQSWREVVAVAYAKPTLYAIKLIYDALQPWKQWSNYKAEQRKYIMNYEYLIERIIMSARIDSLTLNQVAEYLRVNILTSQEQASRDDIEDEDGIRILCTTVHRSKGLEYGTVILPYTYSDISSTASIKSEASYIDSKLSYITTFEDGLHEYNSNFKLSYEGREQLAEESRILYVALTRAIRNCVWMKDLDKSTRVSWGSLLEV